MEKQYGMYINNTNVMQEICCRQSLFKIRHQKYTFSNSKPVNVCTSRPLCLETLRQTPQRKHIRCHPPNKKKISFLLHINYKSDQKYSKLHKHHLSFFIGRTPKIIHHPRQAILICTHLKSLKGLHSSSTVRYDSKS